MEISIYLESLYAYPLRIGPVSSGLQPRLAVRNARVFLVPSKRSDGTAPCELPLQTALRCTERRERASLSSPLRLVGVTHTRTSSNRLGATSATREKTALCTVLRRRMAERAQVVPRLPVCVLVLSTIVGGMSARLDTGARYQSSAQHCKFLRRVHVRCPATWMPRLRACPLA